MLLFELNYIVWQADYTHIQMVTTQVQINLNNKHLQCNSLKLNRIIVLDCGKIDYISKIKHILFFYRVTSHNRTYRQ